MNLQSIRYLSALAKLNHFGKAAKSCFVSQPTLSMQIKKMEDRLGVKLLERNNKSVRLTEIGQSLAVRAQRILEEVKAMQEEAVGFKDPYSGDVKLGVIPTIAPYLLPLVFPKLRKLYPKLSFHVMETQTQNLLGELQQGRLDAAILALPINIAHLVCAPFFVEEFFLATAKDHPLCRYKAVKNSDLQGHKLLLLEEGHCLRDQALEFCGNITDEAYQSFCATSLETLLQMTAAGMGITLAPKLSCQKRPNLVYIPFRDSKPSRTIGLVWRKTTARSVLFESLALTLKEQLEGVKS